MIKKGEVRSMGSLIGVLIPAPSSHSGRKQYDFVTADEVGRCNRIGVTRSEEEYLQRTDKYDDTKLTKEMRIALAAIIVACW